jgi:hypothetical protein
MVAVLQANRILQYDFDVHLITHTTAAFTFRVLALQGCGADPATCLLLGLDEPLQNYVDAFQQVHVTCTPLSLDTAGVLGLAVLAKSCGWKWSCSSIAEGHWRGETCSVLVRNLPDYRTDEPTEGFRGPVPQSCGFHTVITEKYTPVRLIDINSKLFCGIKIRNSPKGLFTPYHVGRCCHNVIRGQCCVLGHYCTNMIPGSCLIMSSNNDLRSFLL